MQKLRLLKSGSNVKKTILTHFDFDKILTFIIKLLQKILEIEKAKAKNESLNESCIINIDFNKG